MSYINNMNLYIVCVNTINVLRKYPKQVRIDLRDFVKKTLQTFYYLDQLIDKLYIRFLFSHGDDSKITIELIRALERLKKY